MNAITACSLLAPSDGDLLGEPGAGRGADASSAGNGGSSTADGAASSNADGDGTSASGGTDVPGGTGGQGGDGNLVAPLDVQASDGTDTGGVYVTWSAVAGAAGYDVHDGTLWNDVGSVTAWRDTNAPLGSVQIHPVKSSDGTFMSRIWVQTAQPTVTPGTSRTYKVRAFGPSGSGIESGTDSGYRGVGGTLNVSLQRSAADGDTNYATINSFTFSGTATDLVFDDPSDSRPIDPDGRFYRFEISVAGAPNAVSLGDRGYARPRPNRTYTITTRTGTVANAQTDECIYARFWDKEDYGTTFMVLDHSGNDRESGQTDAYNFTSGELGTNMCMYIYITAACESPDTSVNGWYVLDVRLQDDVGGSWLWTINNWLDDNAGPSFYNVCL